MSRKMRVLTLKGSQWARGGKNGYSALLNEKGCSCCLGIDALDRGVSPPLLLNVAYPAYIEAEADTAGYKTDWTAATGASLPEARACALINDAKAEDELWIGNRLHFIKTDQERVNLLRPYFRAKRIILRFRPDL